MPACNNARRDVDCWDVTPPHRIGGARRTLCSRRATSTRHELWLCARGKPQSATTQQRNWHEASENVRAWWAIRSFVVYMPQASYPCIRSCVRSVVPSFQVASRTFCLKCCTTQKIQNLPRVVQISAHLHRLVIVKMGDLPKAKPVSRYPWRPLNWSCDETALGTWVAPVWSRRWRRKRLSEACDVKHAASEICTAWGHASIEY